MPDEKPSHDEPGPHGEAAAVRMDDVEVRAAAPRDRMEMRRGEKNDPARSPSADPAQQSPTRRLAQPPWQLHSNVGSRPFGEQFAWAERGDPPPHDNAVDPFDQADEPDNGQPPEADQRQTFHLRQRPLVPPQPAPAGIPLGWVPPPPPGWMPPPPPGTMPPLKQHQTAGPPTVPPRQGFHMPPPLDEAEIVHRKADAPQAGWRRAVHRASGGRINLGESRREHERQLLLARIRQPIAGDFRVAVLSIKGGVGKTTTTLGLGSALAMTRNDRVIAVDANPDRGTLGERVRDNSTQSTVRDLLSDTDIHRYADVRRHTRMAGSRLEVLASEQEPAVSEVFGEEDYRRTVDILRQFYTITLTDCGTGIMHSAMAGVLDLAHTIVLVSAPAIDAARSASATLDWLMEHGHGALVREAHVVLSASRPGSAALNLDRVYEHFQARCRSVHMIPFDPHLAEGADVDIDLLKPATVQAYLELAGAVADKFSRLRGGRHRH